MIWSAFSTYPRMFIMRRSMAVVGSLFPRRGMANTSVTPIRIVSIHISRRWSTYFPVNPPIEVLPSGGYLTLVAPMALGMRAIGDLLKTKLTEAT